MTWNLGYYGARSPEQGYIPPADALALGGKRSGTKLGSVLKGATLLKSASLRTDAFQGSLGGV